MSQNNDNVIWYKKVWAKYLLIVSIVAGLGTAGTFLVKAVNLYNTYKEVPILINDIQTKDSIINKKLDYVVSYVENKKRSFAVGYRVKKEIDEQTGEEVWTKQYRDFKGRWNDIFIDLEMSNYWGYDVYYYIDKDTHEKIYCP